jgi:hypothetical protein
MQWIFFTGLLALRYGSESYYNMISYHCICHNISARSISLCIIPLQAVMTSLIRFTVIFLIIYYNASVESKTGIRYHRHYHHALPQLNVLGASSPIQQRILSVLLVHVHFLGQLKQYRIPF